MSKKPLSALLPASLFMVLICALLLSSTPYAQTQPVPLLENIPAAGDQAPDQASETAPTSDVPQSNPAIPQSDSALESNPALQSNPTLQSNIERSNLTSSPQQLAPPSPASAGLITKINGGIGSNMWADTDIGLAISLLRYLPQQIENIALKELARRLLLTQARAPHIDPALSPADQAALTDEFIALRLERLMDYGFATEAISLFQLMPANSKFDNDRMITRLLMGQHFELLCTGFGQKTLLPSAQLLPKLRIFCEIYQDQRADAALGLQLLREIDQTDPVFIELGSLAITLPSKTEQMEAMLPDISTPLHQALYEIGIQGAKRANIASEFGLNIKNLRLAISNLAISNQAASTSDNDLHYWPISAISAHLQSESPSFLPPAISNKDDFQARFNAWLQALNTQTNSTETGDKPLKIYSYFQIAGLSVSDMGLWDFLFDQLYQTQNVNANPAILELQRKAMQRGQRATAISLLLIAARGQNEAIFNPALLRPTYQTLKNFNLTDIASLLMVQAVHNAL